MEVKAELKEQRAMIQNLQGVPAVPDQEIRCGLQLPLQSLEDFEELERLDETEKNRLVCLVMQLYLTGFLRSLEKYGILFNFQVLISMEKIT